MIEWNKHIRLFANCHLCRGAKRTILYDTQRRDYEFLPNEMYDILILKSAKLTAGQLLQQFKTVNEKKVFTEYLDFLLEREFIFFCTAGEIKNFPAITRSWESPGEISNAIIDIKENSRHDFFKILSGLDDLGCEHIQVRSFDKRPLSYFMKWLPLLEKTCIYDVELLVRFDNNVKDPIVHYSQLLSFPRISSLVVHGTDFEKEVKTRNDQQYRFITGVISGEHHCGMIGEKYFSLTLPHILESTTVNTCLHKKIAVDADGFIRNCPSLQDHYGHITTTSLQDVVAKGDVTKLWGVHKEQVTVCRDCEFRYVCTDCRAYRKEAGDIYSKPAKCNYDPYTNTWG